MVYQGSEFYLPGLTVFGISRMKLPVDEVLVKNYE